MKSLNSIALFFIMGLTCFSANSETIAVPAPKSSTSVSAVPAEAVNPGKDLNELGVAVPVLNKKAECRDLTISPAKVPLLFKEAKTLNFIVNKPGCLKGVLTSDKWVSVSKTETGVSVNIDENDTEEVRRTEIVLAGIDKGISLDILQSNLVQEIPVVKKEIAKESGSKPAQKQKVVNN